MTTKQLIQKQTAEVMAQFGIVDQVEGMTCAQSLRELARRLGLINCADGVAICERLAVLAEKHGA